MKRIRPVVKLSRYFALAKRLKLGEICTNSSLALAGQGKLLWRNLHDLLAGVVASMVRRAIARILYKIKDKSAVVIGSCGE